MTDQRTAHPAFFAQRADGSFRPNPPARGPWSADHCHAGPVTGLLARAFERVIADKMLTRLTIDLVRPVPMDGFRVKAEPLRDGRNAATATAEVTDLHGKVCATARSMHLARSAFDDMPTAPVATPSRADAKPGKPPLPDRPHGQPAFGDFIEVAYPPGNGPGPGPKTVWMRTPPLLDGEQTSPIQSLCPLADCGNGISANATISQMRFVNTDLSVHIHRQPQSEWLASRAVSHWHTNGIGMAEAIIFDEKGPVATALQTLLLRPPG